MPSIGWQELIIILVIVLVIFGPKRLPEVGRSLGKGIKEFKKSTSEIQEQLTGEAEKPKVSETAPTPQEPAQSSEPQASEPKSS
jgi:sec-independent protein translocase protein TatA